ncbi:MAG: bifunctional UDP-N-acetylmuramoyl-tripeptide:D-alanyl-D-alanine ligase/alanine racemase [Bacteroidales bacterium]|nr:bifunctional UDP-N-acetylmuramoyl-tripeptide:D-alanyl-D-alanine ligase/alanine racemase [Bacteroidales bacterium]
MNSISHITTLIGAHRYGSAEAQIAFLLTDSRSLSFPEETLFFALKSKRNDGHRYIEELYKRGVRNFVVEQLPDMTEQWTALCNFLLVPSSLAALQRLAERHRDSFDIPVIGITGSNGKTMVKEWLYQILMPSMHVTRSPRSYNSQIGVPLSVWKLHEGSALGIFEAGISEPNEMQRIADIIQPTIGVFTCLGQAHQENFHSLEDKCREKFLLFNDCKALVYPADDDVLFRVMKTSGFKGRKIGWSMTNPSAPFYVPKVETADAQSTITYVVDGTEHSFSVPFINNAAIENCITCAATALHLGITPEQLAERMPQLEPVAMRLEVKQGRKGCTLINDSYNSDIASLDIALDFMHRRPDASSAKDSTQPLRHTLILSDIDQSGIEDSKLYSKVSEDVVSRGVDKFIGIGTALQQYGDLIKTGEKYFFATTEEFIDSEVFDSLQDEVILIKGARRFQFDRITDLLVEKVHETTLEVNLTALINNLNHYRSMFLNKDDQTRIVCMIKADGYGAGAVEIAKTLQEHRVDYLAVAVADEGVALRKAGITANIMIMNPEMTAFKTMFDYDLEPEVYSFRLLDALRHAARKEGITGYPVHIKLDTGMHRLGFHPIDDMPALIDYLNNQNALIPRSVFSHFVGSDGDEFDDFSAQQFALYEAGSNALQAAFPHKILRHMCNSAGIEHFPERQMDMCRLGLGLYGINPRNNEIIHNVSTLKTTILQLRHVKAGESIGYSRRTVLDRDSVIAAIPIGYADGLNRHLGNRHGYCLVNGRKAEYVGNICMDVCMMDVTDIPCHEGDSVEIFGDNLPVTVLSDILDTIPYEVLTGISNRVKRVYYEE